VSLLWKEHIVTRGKKSVRKKTVAIVPLEFVRHTIHLLRGQRVIVDSDLARIYGVTTKRLNQQVHRNLERFPQDFMFQLTLKEVDALRLQIATSNISQTHSPDHEEVTISLSIGSKILKSQIATSKGRGGRRYLPFAFTEHGAIMAATVLNSKEAVKASLFVVRAFVQMREWFSTHRELAEKLGELERKLENHDEQIQMIIEAIRQLMEEPDEAKKPPIGFHSELTGDAPKGGIMRPVKNIAANRKNRKRRANA
jgi:hypothetical protein